MKFGLEIYSPVWNGRSFIIIICDCSPGIYHIFSAVVEKKRWPFLCKLSKFFVFVFDNETQTARAPNNLITLVAVYGGPASGSGHLGDSCRNSGAVARFTSSFSLSSPDHHSTIFRVLIHNSQISFVNSLTICLKLRASPFTGHSTVPGAKVTLHRGTTESPLLH